MSQKRKVKTRVRVRIPTDVDRQQHSRLERWRQKAKAALFWSVVAVVGVAVIWWMLDVITKAPPRGLR